MSMSELTGYLDALAALHGKKPARASTTHTKSARRKAKPKGKR